MTNDHKPIPTHYQLKDGTVDQQKALEEIEDLFQVSQNRLDILMRGVSQEMRDGLHFPETRDTQNDLKMIPSFVTGNIRTPPFFRRN